MEEKQLPSLQIRRQGLAGLQTDLGLHQKASQRASKSRFSSRPKMQDRIAKDASQRLSAQHHEQLEVQEKYWGTLKPYFFDSKSQVPRIVISKTLLRSFLINTFIIFVVCFWIPVTTNRSMFTQALSPHGFNRLLVDSTVSPRSEEVSAFYSARYVARKYSLYIFSAIWSCYQLFFLGILLLGNPGYGEDQNKQISLEDQAEILRGQRNLNGFNKCSACKAIVDNSVYHCPECDLCCEGFSHHCEWIGKCVGYKNQIFLKAYYYGFFIGILLFILVIVMQSIPTSAL